MVLVDGSATATDWGVAAWLQGVSQVLLQHGHQDAAIAETRALIAGINLGTEQSNNVIVVVDRISIFSNLRYELQLPGKRARSLAYRAVVWQMIAELSNIANHKKVPFKLTLLSRSRAVELGIAEHDDIMKHDWVPHRLIEDARRANEYAPIDDDVQCEAPKNLDHIIIEKINHDNEIIMTVSPTTRGACCR